ncbi:MAG: flagellar filament capping protein FliD [Deltaproteobacteria bacterium]
MSISATSGLISNIDYASLITQLVSLKKIPMTQLSAEKKTLSNQNTAYSNLNSRVNDLKTSAEALKTSDSFNVFSASTTSSTILGATAGSTATSGSYEVIVEALAKAHKVAANGLSSDTTAGLVASGAASITLQVGTGTAQTINVDATTTLTGLKDSINTLDMGITASIVNDGDPTNPYRLILTSDTTGTANALTITEDTSLNFATTLQSAANATFKVDNLSFTRATNSVTDVITGVTLDLKSADAATTVTLSVARNVSAIQSKVSDLLNRYNGVVTYIKANNRYNTDTKVAGSLYGDTVARSIWDDLRRNMTGAISGLPSTMNRLIHVGVEIDKDGNFSLDSTKFTDAIESDFDGVMNLFIDGATTDGFGKRVYDLADDMTDTIDGRIQERIDGLAKNIKRIDFDISNKEKALTAYEEQLRTQFTALETMLSSIQAQGKFLASLTS